jgi:hypothetical protein
MRTPVGANETRWAACGNQHQQERTTWARIAPTRFEDWLSHESASWSSVIDSLTTTGHAVIAAANPERQAKRLVT